MRLLATLALLLAIAISGCTAVTSQSSGDPNIASACNAYGAPNCGGSCNIDCPAGRGAVCSGGRCMPTAAFGCVCESRTYCGCESPPAR